MRVSNALLGVCVCVCVVVAPHRLAYVPFYNTVYFVLLEAMNGKTFKQAWDDYVSKQWESA